MDMIQNLNEMRKLAGMTQLSEDEAVTLIEAKLTGKAKEDFLDKMGKGSKHTKKDKEVDDGKPGPTKDARKSMDAATIKPSTGKKKKVSEQMNEILERFGADLLTTEQEEAVDVDQEQLDEAEALDKEMHDKLDLMAKGADAVKHKGVNYVKKGKKWKAQA